MAVFKIFFSEDNIRRIRVNDVPTYEQFINLLVDLYPRYHPELTLKYLDSDGDKISLDSEMEWEEMMMELHNEPIIKLWIQDLNGQYFKDGPEPETVKFYVDKVTKEAIDVSNDIMSHLERDVTSVISMFFKGGKIIPTHIPEFLKDAISTKYIEENVVDLDIDIQKLFDTLHSNAISLMNSANVFDLEKARDYLIAILTIVPDHCIALYNLACAESLLGNVKAATDHLERAVNCGFRNFTHMMEDADFENIRNTELFQKIASNLAALVEMTENVEEQKTEPERTEVVTVQPVNTFEIEENSEPSPDLSASIMPLKERFTQELNYLNEMGFTSDTDVLLLLLDQYNGNLSDVAQFLLGFSQ